MNKTLALAKLDVLTMKPSMNIKSTLMIIGAGTVMMVSLKSIIIGIFYLALTSIIYGGIPFAAGEITRFDEFYRTLAIERKSVVRGRYLFILFLDGLVFIATFMLAAIAGAFSVGSANIVDWLIVSAAAFALCLTIHAVQMPVYFKMSYSKAKLWTILPFMGLPLILVVFRPLLEKPEVLFKLSEWFTWFFEHSTATSIGLAALTALIYFISYRLSERFYTRRIFD